MINFFKMIKAFIVMWNNIFFNSKRLWIKEARALRENKEERMPLKKFLHPWNVEDYLNNTNRYRWLRDPFDGRWDYISTPEHMQYKLSTWNYADYPQGPYLDDCDGIHFLFGKYVVQIPGVTDVKLLCTRYKGGAHATCLYTYDNQKYHFDYHIRQIKDYHLEPYEVAKRHAENKSSYVYCYSIEDITEKDDLPVGGKVYFGRNN